MVFIIFMITFDAFRLFSPILKMSEIYACMLLNVIILANAGASPFTPESSL